MGESNAHLPRSVDGGNVQVLAPVESTVAVGTIGASSVSVALPANSDIVEIAVSADVRCAFGDSGVVADTSSRVLPKGVYVYVVPEFATHVACLRLTASDVGFFSVATLK